VKRIPRELDSLPGKPKKPILFPERRARKSEKVLLWSDDDFNYYVTWEVEKVPIATAPVVSIQRKP
jgi:hypothetical protein